MSKTISSKSLINKTYSVGFTLIELLIVIAIIGILAAAVIFGVKTATDKSRDSRRLEDIKNLQTALESYYADYGKYPLSGGATLPNGGWSNSSDTSWDTLQTALAPYLPQLPKDPINEAGGSQQHIIINFIL